MASIKQRLIEKLAEVLASKSSARARLVDILLEKHLPEVLAAISQNHSSEALDTLAGSHGSEMIAVMYRDHLSEIIAVMCRDHLSEMIAGMGRDDIDEVIAQVCKTSKGTLKYIGEKQLKVIIGAATTRLPGWFSTDINTLNITHDSAWRNLFIPDSIDNILAEHVLEHLSLDQLYTVLGHARTYLKPGGIFRIAVPDAFHPSRYYYNLVKPGGWETSKQHKLFFDFEMFASIAKDSGYKLRLLEYFDETGIFHKEHYSQDDGAIVRCAKNNVGLATSDSKVMEKFYSTIPEHLRQQFYDRNMTYTSLIVDLIK